MPAMSAASSRGSMEFAIHQPAPTINTSRHAIADAVLGCLFIWAPAEPKA
jgi:hypothetical protein